jgi:hypothetical protein
LGALAAVFVHRLSTLDLLDPDAPDPALATRCSAGHSIEGSALDPKSLAQSRMIVHVSRSASRVVAFIAMKQLELPGDVAGPR